MACTGIPRGHIARGLDLGGEGGLILELCTLGWSETTCLGACFPGTDVSRSPGCVLSTLPPRASQASSCTLLILSIPITECQGWEELQSHLVYFSRGFFIFNFLIFLVST